MTDQTREVIRQRREQITDEQRENGWEYVYWVENNCIYGAYQKFNGYNVIYGAHLCPDGTVEDIEVLQILER